MISGLGFVTRFADLAGVPDEAERTTEAVISFPPTYSFLDDPESALRVAGEIATRVGSGCQRLYFDQSKCTQVDLCAESVSCAIAHEASTNGITVDGEYPRREFVEARGSVAAFGIPAQFARFTPESTTNQVIVPLQRANHPPGSDGVARARRASRLVETAVEGLDGQFSEFRLGAKLAEGFSDFLGEALGNVVDHADGDWWVAVSSRWLDHLEAARCQVVVFSLGDTLCENLRRMPPGELRGDFEKVIGAHRSAGYLEGDTWTEENLWTVAALQHGISRFGGENDRGAGTLKIIQFFEYLGESSSANRPPRMCIVSGQSHILFDGRYRLLPSTSTGRAGKLDIAFNEPNDLKRPPNSAIVRNLNRAFPGTLISLQFYIHQKQLENREEGYGSDYDSPSRRGLGARYRTTS